MTYRNPDQRRVKVGEEVFTVRDGTSDLDMICPIILEDEYQLMPIKSDGHNVQWCLDIGASIGGFTRRVKRLWPSAQVIAAEPAPDSAELFRRNTEGLSGIYFYEAAIISGASRDVTLCECWDGQPASRFILEMVRELVPAVATRDPLSVRGIGIRDLLSRHGNPQIDVLKLDCEGTEAMILEDLRDAKYLGNVRWVRGEWHHWSTIPRVRDALLQTHQIMLDENSADDGHDNSYFLGHRRK